MKGTGRIAELVGGAKPEGPSRRKMLAFAMVALLLLTFVQPAGTQSDGDTEWSDKKRIMTLDIRVMDINDFLKIMSDTTGLTIIPSAGVKGKISLWVKDAPVMDVLEEALGANGLVSVREGNILSVMTQEEYATRFGRERKVFTVEHANVTNLAVHLKTLATRTGRIIADARTGKIVVIDSKGALSRIEEAITQLDQGTVTRAFRLMYADPEEVKAKLQNMVSKEGKIEADKRSGQVIVTDIRKNVEIMGKIIEDLDCKPVRRVFILKYANAEALKAILDKLVSATGKVEADKWSNLLIATETEDGMAELEQTIKALDRELETYVYQLNYADPKVIAEKLAKFLPEGEGRVEVDERTDTVAIIAIPERIAQVKKLLPVWDKKSQQVLIEAKIMLVSVGRLSHIGIDWSYWYPGGHPMGASGRFLPDLGESDPKLTMAIGSLSSDQYQAAIELLQTDSDTDLLSSPRILALDKKEAMFSVGSDEPYKVVTIQDSTRIEDVQFVRVGVSLTVTPSINDEGLVMMKVHPEISSLTEIREGVPVVEKREAQSQVMVEDGRTIVIGGLIIKEKLENVSKVPLLGDIPLLGLLFQKKRIDTTNRELVIFLTPRITDHGEAKDHVITIPRRPTNDMN